MGQKEKWGERKIVNISFVFAALYLHLIYFEHRLHKTSFASYGDGVGQVCVVLSVSVKFAYPKTNFLNI